MEKAALVAAWRSVLLGGGMSRSAWVAQWAYGTSGVTRSSGGVGLAVAAEAGGLGVRAAPRRPPVCSPP